MNIGDPVKIKGVLGRVTNLNVLGGGGCIEMTTPHGTRINSGLCWVEDLTPEDQVKLDEYTADAKEKLKEKVMQDLSRGF